MYVKIILLSLLIYSNTQAYTLINNIIENLSSINDVDHNDKTNVIYKNSFNHDNSGLIAIHCDEDNNFNFASEKNNSENNILGKNNITELKIDFKNEYDIKFDSDDNIYNNDLIVNIHSINCFINIKNEKNFYINKRRNHDTFSLRINSDYINNATIKITPITYLINEGEKEYYKSKTCPIIITNYENKQSEIPILNLINNSNIYFDEEFKEIKFIYKIENLDKDTPIALSLTFNQKTKFEIIIKVEGKEIINKIITYSTNIMFETEFKANQNLEIYIIHKDNDAEIFMNVKMIKNTSISILEQNNLNFGFITSNIEYQYYYMEVFKYQEGEIMLHSKRTRGILYAKLMPKDINPDLNNNYPKNELDSTLKFNQHNLKLYFNYNDTLTCDNGCYLLITYYKEKYNSIEKNNLIGYEYTILARVWDYMEYSPQIINIPFNEYVFGSFEQGSILDHYYTIFIPNDTDKIIIQFEGNYLDGFIGEGNIKLNIIKPLKEIKNLNIINKINVFYITEDYLGFDFKNKSISLAFRSKNNFDDIFPFYNFRILYLKENEVLYYPADSDFSNLCLPEKENKTYFCNIILRNDYNDINENFAISSESLIERFSINKTVYNKNNTTIDSGEYKFKYLYMNGKNNSYDKYNDSYNNNEVGYFLFRFEFYDEGIKGIISSFLYKLDENFPQIYSSRLFIIDNSTVEYKFSLTNNYTLDYKWVAGWNGNVILNTKNLPTNRNFRGKPISFQVNSDTSFNVSITDAEFIFYLKLKYDTNNKGMDEIISGQTRSEIVNKVKFPLYYYLKLKKREHVNVDINIRLNSYNISYLKNNFLIMAYLLDEYSIIRKIRGEYINLKDERNETGIYCECYGIGFLQIKNDNINEKEYVLITISSKSSTQIYLNSDLLIEIISHEHLDDSEKYFLPINQFLVETFKVNENYTKYINRYSADVDDRYNSRKKRYSDVLIEFSPNYEDLELNFGSDYNFNYTFFQAAGFKKYRLTNINSSEIYFNVTNPKNRTNATYLLRYYYSDKDNEDEYHFYKDFKSFFKNTTDDISISLMFKNINITRNSIPFLNKNYTIAFYIYGYLYRQNNDEEELVNTSTIIYSRNSIYNATATSLYLNDTYFTLNFENISRNNNGIYELQLKINTIIDYINFNIFGEEFLCFTVDLDLTDIRKKEKENNNGDNSDNTSLIVLIIGLSVVGLIIISIVLVIIYRKYKKSNKRLEQQAFSIDYTAEIEKNFLKEEAEARKKDNVELNLI